MGWRRVFTGFDEDIQRIPRPKRLSFSVGERTVTVEFHYFFQRFLLEEDREVEELFPWE